MRVASVCIVLGAVLAAALLAHAKQSTARSKQQQQSQARPDVEQRAKRQLHPGAAPDSAPVSVSHYYNTGPIGAVARRPPSPPAPERRISTGPHHPHYPPQFFPGPPVRTQYRKGRPQPLPAPPYAVPMEPLAHYSQRDPLYDTNALSPNADGHRHREEPLADTNDNHLAENIERGGTIYVPHRPHIIEKPVYIKEPEPIIEIIIKESNVSLPPPPTAPPPPKKKKEEVQVFYVKYKKNPYGSGKDSIIYDKPVPAISPTVPDEEEEEQQEDQGYSYNEVVTNPPPPSTTLRTIIKPDSEVYHSPSGIKVTFGKEGFDYEKRSNKPEDYQPQPQAQPPHEPVDSVPQPRQLSSFSNAYYKRPFPPPSFFQTLQNVFRPDSPRVPQPYKPFNFPPPPTSFNSRPPSRPSGPPPSQTQTKYPFQSPPYVKPSSNFFSQGPPSNKPPFPAFAHSISHPPPHFQSNGGPTPQYQPNPNYHTIPQDLLDANPIPQHPPNRPPAEFNPHPPQFNEQPKPRQPVPYKPFDNFKPGQPTFTHPPQPTSGPPTPPPTSHFNLPHSHTSIQFRPESHFPVQQQLPLQQPTHVFNSQLKNNFNNEVSQQQPQQNHQQFAQQPSLNQQQSELSQNEHLSNLQTAQSILPAGGQLIHSVPKFEQHLIVNSNGQTQQAQQVESSNTQYQQQNPHQQRQQQSLFSHDEYDKIQQQLLSSRENTQNIPQNRYQSVQHSEQRSNNQIYHTTPKSVSHGPTKRIYQSTTETTTTTTTEPPKPPTTTKDPKVLQAQLPDEVPDDLREQLLSSGILNNADISILDYDKVGDIPLSALPPEQLANFYNAGGGQQIAAAGSEPVPQIIAQPLVRAKQEPQEDLEQTAEASEVQEVRVKPDDVEMKVVRYNPETEKGQQVQEAYVADDAKQVDPVVLNDSSYNRYLPLKVNGTQFPIPDVPELKGKKISSVVVLAPVAYDFSSERKTRDAKDTADLDLIQEETLKELLVDPTEENYKKFLESQNNTEAAKQSVILLVTGDEKGKEIYMYDIATKSVNKLSGELSAAFVDAAEANSSNDDAKEVDTEASNIVETKVAFEEDSAREETETLDLEDSASNIDEIKVPILESTQEDLSPEASESVETIVDISGLPLKQDFSELNSLENDVLITSGYSKAGHS